MTLPRFSTTVPVATERESIFSLPRVPGTIRPASPQKWRLFLVRLLTNPQSISENKTNNAARQVKKTRTLSGFTISTDITAEWQSRPWSELRWTTGHSLITRDSGLLLGNVVIRKLAIFTPTIGFRMTPG